MWRSIRLRRGLHLVLIDDLKIGDLTNVITSAACVYLAWQQNRIFERQNQIISGQSSGLPMLHKAPRRSIKQYWPTIIMAVLICVTGYDYYDRHAKGASLGGSPLPWWILIIAAALGILIGKVLGVREPATGESTAEWRQGFCRPRFEIVDDHKFENEEIVVDNKSFRRCSFKNVKLLFHGQAPFEFVEGTTIDRGTVFFNTDDPAVMAFNFMQTKFSTLPGAKVEHGALDSKGKEISLPPLTVEPSPSWVRFLTAYPEIVGPPAPGKEPAKQPQKIRCEFLNCMDFSYKVKVLSWDSGNRGLPADFWRGCLQLHIGTSWCPEWNGVEELHVPPGESFRMWLYPRNSLSDNLFKERVISGDLGTVHLLLNGKEIAVSIG
jgi:hypothetical protein